MLTGNYLETKKAGLFSFLAPFAPLLATMPNIQIYCSPKLNGSNWCLLINCQCAISETYNNMFIHDAAFYIGS